MPIKLGTFDIIIGVDWLVKHDAVIVCGEKVVHIPYGDKTLIVKGDKGVSQLKVISCIKARKYIERAYKEVMEVLVRCWSDGDVVVRVMPTSVPVIWFPFTNRNSDQPQTSEHGVQNLRTFAISAITNSSDVESG
ncbi:hypothetical protein Tco_0351960 [Tanacetum coccineum]